MDWRTLKKSKLISEQLSPFEFVEACKNGNKNILTKILDEEGSPILSDFDATTIIEKTIKDYSYEDYEALAFKDFPSLVFKK